MRMDSVIRIISGIGLYAEFEDVCLFGSRKDVRGPSWFVTCRDSAKLDQSKGSRPLSHIAVTTEYFASEGQVARNIL
jgi:hypothetical protein